MLVRLIIPGYNMHYYKIWQVSKKLMEAWEVFLEIFSILMKNKFLKAERLFSWAWRQKDKRCLIQRSFKPALEYLVC